jgi:hypothetical protein
MIDGDVVVVAATLPNVAYSGSSFTSRLGTMYSVARYEEGVDCAGPEEEECE